MAVTALAVVGGAAATWAYFTARATTTDGIEVAALAAPAAVDATFPDPTIRTVQVSWSTTVAPNGDPVDGYFVERITGSTSNLACGSSPTSLLPASTSACNDTEVPSGSYSYRVTAVFRTWTATSPASDAVTVPLAELSSFRVMPPTTSPTAGVPFAVTITALDQYGSVFPAYDGAQCVTFASPRSSPNGTQPTYPAAGGCGTGSSSVNFSAGSATVAVTLVNAETTTLQVTDRPSGRSGTSANLTVGAAAASMLGFVGQPTTTAAATAISPPVTVDVRDQFSNRVAGGGRTVSMAVASGPGTFTGSSTTAAATDGTGLATFSNLVLNTAGTYTLRATATGLDPAVSASFTVNPANANVVAFVVQPSTTTAGNAIFPSVTVQVRDQAGNPVLLPSVSVTISVASGPGTFTAASTTTVTTVLGSAAFSNLVLNTAGTYTLRAAATGVTPAVSTSFTVSPAAPTLLAFVQPPTNTTAGTAIAPPVTVQVRDRFGNNVPGAGRSVAMAVASGPGPFTPTSTTSASTDGGGLATFSNLVLRSVGTYTLRATSSGLTSATSAPFGVVDTTPPIVTFDDPGHYVRGTVTLNAAASDSGSGLASLRIQGSAAGAGNWTDICTVTTATASCSLSTTTLANDYFDLRAVATDAAGNQAASLVPDVLVDNALPTVTLTNPGSPLAGAVTLSATASDAGSGVASVTFQVTPTGTGNWTTICVTTEAPYTCRYDTTTRPDGGYDFRAVATDLAQNTATSPVVANRVVDNTQSSVSMRDPGAFLTGVVTLTADAFSNAGVTSVRTQRAPAGTATWTDICTVTTSPYSCSWDTRTVADGLYDFRAVLLDGSGQPTLSTPVTSRVDNSPARGADVQTTNASGGVVGRIGAGDSISFTYTTTMQPGTIAAGWTGSARPVLVRVRDGGLVGGGGKDDRLDVLLPTNPTSMVNLGFVNLKGDFVKGGKTMTFNATMALETVTVDGRPASRVVITIGTVVSGSGVRTSVDRAAMIWTPSASAIDTAGNPCSVAPATQTGTPHINF